MSINHKFKNNFKLAPSNIHGTGVFALKNFKRRNIIGIGIFYILYYIPQITNDLGRWLNHSYNPNCVLYYHEKSNNYLIVAIREILKNDEITINYNHTPWYIRGAENDFV